MSQSSTGSAWRGWRSEVGERIDRQVAAAAMANVAIVMTFFGIGATFPSLHMTLVRVAAVALLCIATAMATVLALAAAMVAVTRGVSGWVAYPLALLAVELVAIAVSLALDPHAWFVAVRAPTLPAMA